MAICMVTGANALHMVHVMPLPSIVDVGSPATQQCLVVEY